MGLFLPFERRGEPLAPRWLFARRLVINIGLALALILVSLVAGMVGYHYIEGSGLARCLRPDRDDPWRHGPLQRAQDRWRQLSPARRALFRALADRGHRLDLGAALPPHDALFPPARRRRYDGRRIQARQDPGAAEGVSAVLVGQSYLGPFPIL